MEGRAHRAKDTQLEMPESAHSMQSRKIPWRQHREKSMCLVNLDSKLISANYKCFRLWVECSKKPQYPHLQNRLNCSQKTMSRIR